MSYTVAVDRSAVFGLLDRILPLWQKKAFPYDQKQAIIPQTLIPEGIAGNKRLLANFYFYCCIYMRGGIESIQAFRQLISLWEDYPYLFDPKQAQLEKPKRLQTILRSYIGWDSKNAAKFWIENSQRLCEHWDGCADNLIPGMHDYAEATRRIKNKTTLKEKRAAGPDGLGFIGFQPKMVSMLVYFFDWHGLLEKRFPFPAPADFHNFRLGLAHRGLLILPIEEIYIRVNEKLSKAWRDVLMEYIIERNADPVEVADAIWMFSLVLCGNSPVNQFSIQKEEGDSDKQQEDLQLNLFKKEDIPPKKGRGYLAGLSDGVRRTCLVCPIRSTCMLAIPATHYYSNKHDVTGRKMGGRMLLQPHPLGDMSRQGVTVEKLSASVQAELTETAVFDL